MKAILDIAKKAIQPKSVFKSVEITEDSIRLSADVDFPTIPGEDDLTELVNTYINQCSSSQMVNNKFVRKLDERRLVECIMSHVKSFHNKLWCIVNKKVNFRRTNLSKSVNKNRRTEEFNNVALELYLDANKYGITSASIHQNMVITPLHKFIASKYEAIAED